MMNSIFDLQNYFFNIYALPHFLVGVLITIEGIFIFTQSKKSMVSAGYLIVALACGLWLTGVGFVYSSSNEVTAFIWSRFYSWLGIVFATPGVYHFSVAWDDPFLVKKSRILYFNYVTASIFYIICISSNYLIQGVWHYSIGFYPKAGPLEGPFIIWFYTLMFLSFSNFVRAYRKEKTPIKKKTTKLMFVAYAIALFGSVEYLPNYGIYIFPVAYFPMFLFITIMGYCVVRYKIMDIETVIHKTIGWFLTSVALITPLASLLYLTRSWYTSLTPLGAWSYLGAVLLGFLFFMKSLQPKVDHFFQRRHSNLQQALDQFLGELVHLKNLEDLLERSVRTLQENLYAKQISIYLRDGSDAQFLPARMAGVRDLQAVTTGDPFLRILEGRDTVIVADLAEGDPDLEKVRESMRDYFNRVQALVVVPLVLGGKLIGLVNLGKKENLRKYRSDEIHFLSQMKSSMTIAISNSQQFENVSRLFQQVQVQNGRLKELDRLKSEFLANTSHELRTPLNGILGLVESILDGSDGPLNDLQHGHLRMIVESGSGLKELINNLLELSRIESGQEKLNVKAFNVVNVIDAVTVLLETLAKKKDIGFERLVPRQVSDVYGDPEKIQRILINLVGNAIKFTEKGKVVVRAAEAVDSVSVSVEDTGIGISPQDQELIFDRFRQVEGGPTRRFEGTGLGLSIAGEIARLHGSDIRVESQLGVGSTFSFSLPKKPFTPALYHPQERLPGEWVSAGRPARKVQRKDDESQSYGEDAEFALEKDKEFQEAVRGNGEKILIIDDNEVNRAAIRTRLELSNYQVIEAVDGIDGLEKMKHEKTELVILDLMMPRMSGYEFCKRIRTEHTPDEFPIIMLTAKTDMGDKIYGLQLGANDYISKPFNKEELIARVGVLLRIRQMSRELRRWNEELEKRVDERTDELIRTQQQLIQAEKLATIGTLAGGVAHEINNPLAAVLTNAQMLKAALRDDDERESIGLIEEGAKRCQSIVQKLMKYARKPAGIEETPKEVDLNGVIESTVSFLSYQLEQENIRLIKHLNPMPKIKGVANELEQVFTNLVLNAKDAVKASKDSGAVEIETFERNGSVCASVTDDGVGIPKEHLSKIFDPFFTTKEIGKGIGLGLSIIYGIIENHGGKIEVSSVEGRGTTVTVVLPKHSS